MAKTPSRRQKCTAHSKRTGLPCRNWAVAERTVCRMHGGHAGAPIGNENAVKTGENAPKALTRWERFQQECDQAPTDHQGMRESQARRNHARLQFMYQQLLQTETAMEALAAEGDSGAAAALAIVEISRKQEPRTVGEGSLAETHLVDVEMSTKSRSLLDRWLAQQAAIDKAERTYGSIAEGLRPRDGTLGGGGGIGTLIINNTMPGVDSDTDADPDPDDT